MNINNINYIKYIDIEHSLIKTFILQEKIGIGYQKIVNQIN